ncbi:hypothetical protein [Rhodovarius lipocyclicus]|uniref:hypothetical protein n=1 Tax=Rhodovarius lipocyclicus TaxID=268410 RepID=UPI0013573D3F|nr:hypothetical protein [Rhodovarius lipocyclicus]
MPNLAEKLEQIGADFAAIKESAKASEENHLGLFLAALNVALTQLIEALAAAHRDRATLDDHDHHYDHQAGLMCKKCKEVPARPATTTIIDHDGPGASPWVTKATRFPPTPDERAAERAVEIGASLTPPPSLAPICAELGLSPGEDVGAIVAAIRAVRERAVEIVKEQLSTPEGVHINMLRATIARLTWDQCIHLHPVAYAQAVSEAVAKAEAKLIREFIADCTGHPVGAGDGDTYIVKTPNIRAWERRLAEIRSRGGEGGR